MLPAPLAVELRAAAVEVSPVLHPSALARVTCTVDGAGSAQRTVDAEAVRPGRFEWLCAGWRYGLQGGAPLRCSLAVASTAESPWTAELRLSAQQLLAAVGQPASCLVLPLLAPGRSSSLELALRVWHLQAVASDTAPPAAPQQPSEGVTGYGTGDEFVGQEPLTCCSSCGAEWGPSARFCGSCGTALDAPPGLEPRTPTPLPSRRRQLRYATPPSSPPVPDSGGYEAHYRSPSPQCVSIACTSTCGYSLPVGSSLQSDGTRAGQGAIDGGGGSRVHAAAAESLRHAAAALQATALQLAVLSGPSPPPSPPPPPPDPAPGRTAARWLRRVRTPPTPTSLAEDSTQSSHLYAEDRSRPTRRRFVVGVGAWTA
eukprot:TRINITY_DN36004_c0_g1_i1.p1 TRINITY_DN36004_c0_g1~~TRINITY_DN36004_c0_g1_i1.p1  ORF type:complete len:394 (+),score=95.05 TRINITY_DN36004_c0_g1_i1:70-1182(+)